MSNCPEIRATKPRVKLKFKILAPKILPKEIRGWPLKAELRPIANSGRVVAKAIKIKERVNSEILKK